MITCKEIEHFDNFGDSIIFWCVAENIPQKYIKNAINLDGENYLSDCFGACVVFDSDGFHMCQDEEKYELYYIDNNGDKHWMEKEFTNDESKTFFEMCFEQITSLIPEWNGNLLGEYVRGWNIQSLIFMERNGDYYV